MSKKAQGEMSDVAINNMFSDIGRAKEETAKSIIEKRERDEEEARRKRNSILFGGAMQDFDEDIDLDEMERRIDEELELARKGKIVESEASQTGERLEPTMMDIDNSHTEHIVSESETGERPVTEELQFGFEDERLCDSAQEDDGKGFNEDFDEGDDTFDLTDWPAKGEKVSDSQPTEDEVDVIEIMDVVVPESNDAYLSVVTNAEGNKAGYAFILVLSNGDKISRSMCVPKELTRQAAFLGAIELFSCIEKSKITSLILHTEPDVGNLLKRNATYGIVDEYSESCAHYVSFAKELAGKCFLRIMNGFPNSKNIYSILADATAKAMVIENAKR